MTKDTNKCEFCGSTTNLKITGGMRKKEYLDKQYDFATDAGHLESIADFQNPDTWEWAYFICEKCDNDSEAAYQRSCLDVDYRESQLAEMEY